VEFTMPTYPHSPVPVASRHPAPGAELLDLLQTAATGVFPGAALEALIARLEVGK
jgi:hypothetical protein